MLKIRAANMKLCWNTFTQGLNNIHHFNLLISGRKEFFYPGGTQLSKSGLNSRTIFMLIFTTICLFNCLKYSTIYDNTKYKATTILQLSLDEHLMNTITTFTSCQSHNSQQKRFRHSAFVSLKITCTSHFDLHSLYYFMPVHLFSFMLHTEAWELEFWVLLYMLFE